MFGPRSHNYGIAVRVVATILTATIVYWTIIGPFSAVTSVHDNGTSSPSESWKDQPKLDLLTPNATCQNSDNAGRIVVVLRTGATEAYTKVPTQLLTALQCVPNLLIVSDMEQDISGYHLHDVLKNVTPNIRENHPDFDLYRLQRALQQEGLIDNLESVVAKKYNNKKRELEKAALTLDKYKYFHMMYLAWEKYSQKDWFVFIESDTYLVWPTLLQWLDTLDPAKELLIGSPTYKSDDRLAYGGSGIILSNAAMRKIAVEHADEASDLDVRMKVHASGDYLFSKALQEWDIPIQGVWPMLGGESPATLPYGPAAWCEPVITLHGMTPGDIDRVWTFAKNRPATQPMLHRDLYTHFLTELPSKRDDWTNACAGSVFEIDDIKADMGRAKYADCERACLDFPQCFQFSYLDGAQCHLYTCFSLGRAAEPDNVKHWHSGWITWRIRDWIDEAKTCEARAWVQYSERNIRHTGWDEIDAGIDAEDEVVGS